MARKPATRQPGSAPWELRLYVTDWEPRSAESWSRLNELCEQYLPGLYRIEVVDLLKEPRRSHQEQIVALPTVVRRRPLPEKRTIGRLTETDKVVAALGLGGGAPSEAARRAAAKARPRRQARSDARRQA